MSKYSKELERGLKELETFEKEIRKTSSERGLERLRDYHLRNQKLNNYFNKYRDKGSGGENYRNFLRAKGHYDSGKRGNYGDKKEREEKIIKTFEDKVKYASKEQRRYWNRKDYEIYEAVRDYRIDLTSEGYFRERWA